MALKAETHRACSIRALSDPGGVHQELGAVNNGMSASPNPIMREGKGKCLTSTHNTPQTLNLVVGKQHLCHVRNHFRRRRSLNNPPTHINGIVSPSSLTTQP